MDLRAGVRIARKLIKTSPLQGLWFLLVWLSPVFSSASLFYLSYQYRSLTLDQPVLLYLFLFMSIPLLASGLLVSTSLCVAMGYLQGWTALFYLFPAYLAAAFVGRWIFGKWWEPVFQALLAEIPNLEREIKFFHFNAFLTVLSTRVMPVLPFALMNVAYVFLKIPGNAFYMGSAVGMLPRAALSVWAGALAYEAQQDPGYFLSHKWYSLGLFCLFCLAFLGMIIILKQRNRR